MTDDETRRSANEPEESHERRRKPQERNADYEESRVEVLLAHEFPVEVF